MWTRRGLLAASGFALGACGAGKKSGKPVIGVSLLNLSNEFIVKIDRAIRAQAAQAGVELIVNDAQRSAERQVQQVESFIAQKVDAIILNPCEVEASSPAVDKARAAGIPLVNVNSETRAEPTAFAGSHDEESAQLAIDYIASRLQGQGQILLMHGFMGQAAQLKRDAGAKEALKKHPGLKILAEQTAEWDRAKAVALMENWIQSYGARINAVFAHNDEMGMGALLALEQAGRKKDVVVVSVDAIADAVQAVKDGRLDATVFQDAEAQGRSAVGTALQLIRKQPYEKTVWVPFKLVTRSSIPAGF